MRALKTRQRRPSATIVAPVQFLIAALLAATISGCSDDTPKVDVEDVDRSSVSSKYGGPYEYKLGPSKIIDFGIYVQKELFFSEGRRLNKDLFCDSLSDNREWSPHFQRYTYVIDHKDAVIVSVWKLSVPVHDIDAARCDGKGRGIRRISPYKTKAGRMIETSNEDKNGPIRRSACWLAVPRERCGAAWKNEPHGIFEAMSKHFMLSQRKATISAFDPAEWVKTTVAYAGEIVVRLDSGRFEINRGSGTYWPLTIEAVQVERDGFRARDSKFLPKVADRFEELLGERPRLDPRDHRGKQGGGRLERVCPDLL